MATTKEENSDQFDQILVELQNLSIRQQNDTTKLYNGLTDLAGAFTQFRTEVRSELIRMRWQIDADKAELRDETLALNVKLDKLLEH